MNLNSDNKKKTFVQYEFSNTLIEIMTLNIYNKLNVDIINVFYN